MEDGFLDPLHHRGRQILERRRADLLHRGARLVAQHAEHALDAGLAGRRGMVVLGRRRAVSTDLQQLCRSSGPAETSSDQCRADDYHRGRAEAALSVLDVHLADRNYLGAPEPTIADLFCHGDAAFAEVCAFDVNRRTNVALWTKRVTALPGFKPPFELLAMENAEFA